MKMKRRGFMGSIAAALTINPSSQIEAVAGHVISPTIGSLTGSGAVAGVGASTSWATREKAKISLLKMLNPKWFEQKRRMAAKNVNRLDIDIASFQSVSMAGKIAMQRERNYQTEYMREYDWAEIREAEDQFEAANKFFQS
jgi:hypothetical protein